MNECLSVFSSVQIELRTRLYERIIYGHKDVGRNGESSLMCLEKGGFKLTERGKCVSSISLPVGTIFTPCAVLVNENQAHRFGIKVC